MQVNQMNTQSFTGQATTLSLTDNSPSFARLVRQCFYMPWQTKRYFNQASKVNIETAVKQAEQGHSGEIQVVIEGSLPLSFAYHHTTEQRAFQLFSSFQVWDTAFNTGILLYINLCEKSVNIVADRGIHQAVPQTRWEAICNTITGVIKSGDFEAGVVQGVAEIGLTLQLHHDALAVELLNERPDGAIFL